MLRIRKEQMDAFQQAAERSYRIRLVHFLRQQFPDAAECEETSLTQEVGEQVLKARSYGFLTERQIANYVISAWLLGRDFDTEFPVVQQMLGSELPPDEKSGSLEQFTTELFHQLERSA